MIWPVLPPQYRTLWDGALARLKVLHELEAPAVDIYAAREYRDDLCTKICDYFLARWDSLSVEERESMLLVMSRIPYSREVDKLAFESMRRREK